MATSCAARVDRPASPPPQAAPCRAPSGGLRGSGSSAEESASPWLSKSPYPLLAAVGPNQRGTKRGFLGVPAHVRNRATVQKPRSAGQLGRRRTGEQHGGRRAGSRKRTRHRVGDLLDFRTRQAGGGRRFHRSERTAPPLLDDPTSAEGISPGEIAVRVADAPAKAALYPELRRRSLPKPARWIEEGARTRGWF